MSCSSKCLPWPRPLYILTVQLSVNAAQSVGRTVSRRGTKQEERCCLFLPTRLEERGLDLGVKLCCILNSLFKGIYLLNILLLFSSIYLFFLDQCKHFVERLKASFQGALGHPRARGAGSVR